MSQFTPKMAPFTGLPPHMSIADIPPRHSKPVVILDTVVTNTLSDAVNLGSRGVSLHCEFEDPEATCDVALYKVTASGDELVKAWTGVTYATPLHAGNCERVDLQGAPIKVEVSNISFGWVTASASHLY